MQSFKICRIPGYLFGSSKVFALPDILETFGTKFLLITGQKSLRQSGTLGRLMAMFKEKGYIIFHYTVRAEPSPRLIDQISAAVRNDHPEAVIAIGGGSVLDTGKGVAAMVVTKGSVLDYLEGVGKLKPPGDTLPLIAVPTTAGTGSEATSNAVLSEVGKGGFKKSLRHVNYIPKYIILDPSLTKSLSRAVTLNCGMDALSQLIEAYLSVKSSPFIDLLALDGIKRIINVLPVLAENREEDDSRRAQMLYSAFLSGICLANAGLGLVHGIAGPVGGLLGAPHGLICALLLAPVMKYTYQALKDQDKSNTQAGLYLEKMANLGRLLKNYAENEPAFQGFIDLLYQLSDLIKPACLKDYGSWQGLISRLPERISYKNHPVIFKPDVLERLLQNIS